MQKFDEKFSHKVNLHPKMLKTLKALPEKLNDLKNIIFYGPPGIGKHTLTLKFIRRYSLTDLKYEKKMTIISLNAKDSSYNIKMSDIHYEIDMSTLGCNSKALWHDIFIQIVDNIYMKKEKIAIIVCKSFHEISNELLEIFYSYLQDKNNEIFYRVKVRFILLTDHVSFLTDGILNACRVYSLPKPTQSTYKRCNLIRSAEEEDGSYLVDCVVNYLLKPTPIKIAKLRELIYDLLTYNLNIPNTVWLIFFKLFDNFKCKPEILDDCYNFFFYYNNHYRPIFHLEWILLRFKLRISD